MKTTRCRRRAVSPVAQKHSVTSALSRSSRAGCLARPDCLSNSSRRATTLGQATPESARILALTVANAGAQTDRRRTSCLLSAFPLSLASLAAEGTLELCPMALPQPGKSPANASVKSFGAPPLPLTPQTRPLFPEHRSGTLSARPTIDSSRPKDPLPYDPPPHHQLKAGETREKIVASIASACPPPSVPLLAVAWQNDGQRITRGCSSQLGFAAVAPSVSGNIVLPGVSVLSPSSTLFPSPAHSPATCSPLTIDRKSVV